MKAIHAIKLAGGALIVAVSVGAWAQASDTGMGMAASGGMMSQPTSKKDMRRANRALERKIRQAFNHTKGLDASMITIKARSGVVSLAGSVPDESQINMAGQAAQGVEGVSQVKNGVSLKEEGQ